MLFIVEERFLGLLKQHLQQFTLPTSIFRYILKILYSALKQNEPWTLVPKKGAAQTEVNANRLHTIVHNAMEAVRIAAILMLPIMPGLFFNKRWLTIRYYGSCIGRIR